MNLTAAINGVQHARAVAGWPVELRIISEAEVRIEVRDERGAMIPCPWNVVPGHPGVWMLDPEFTATLSLGCYEVAIMFAGNPEPAHAWLAIDLPPAVPDRSFLFEKLRWFVRYDRLRGCGALALPRLDAWLAEHPSDFRALAWKAEILEALGRTFDAIGVWSQTVDAAGQNDSGWRRAHAGALGQLNELKLVAGR